MLRDQEISFIFEDGVLKPDSPVDLPDGARGVARIRLISEGPNDFWKDFSIEELRKQQGTLPVRDLSDLAGDWPNDDSIDEFLDSVRRGRC